ncbi:hypothetical protein MMC28_006565 [Mycoblastus sanguinarius]|nr:hypothetical protein [Mycoblastus sanguinarius]
MSPSPKPPTISSIIPNHASSIATTTARFYYNSLDADAFYHTIWGGEDIQTGLYTFPSDAIATASHRTVSHMAALAGPITYPRHGRWLRRRCTIFSPNVWMQGDMLEPVRGGE